MRLSAKCIAGSLVFVAMCTACANTRFNQIGPGERAGEPPPPMPDAIDFTASGSDVHLDPTVMLWAPDAELDLRQIIRTEIARIDRRLDGTPVDVAISAGS